MRHTRITPKTTRTSPLAMFKACLALFFGISATPAFSAPASETKLWYDKPATKWMQEALPIGNGYMGAMLFGGVEADQIQFNEESLWIGDEGDTGSYQAFGDVWVRFGVAAGQPATATAEVAPSGYRRELDLNRAVHSVGYVQAGVKYRREAFASYPARVMAFRYSADKPGALTGSVVAWPLDGSKYLNRQRSKKPLNLNQPRARS